MVFLNLKKCSSKNKSQPKKDTSKIMSLCNWVGIECGVVWICYICILDMAFVVAKLIFTVEYEFIILEDMCHRQTQTNMMKGFYDKKEWTAYIWILF